MKLVERSKELAALNSLLDGARRGVGGVAVIDGPLASGKTALLHEFAERSAAEGTVFLSAASSRIELTLPLGVVDQILQSAQALLPDTEAAARPLIDPAATPAAPQAPDRAAADGPVVNPALADLYPTLRRLAEQQPVIIGIDDAHLIDPDSLQCLLLLIRRLKPFGVLFVFCGCLQSQQAHWLLQAEIVRLPNCVTLGLKVLSPAGVEALLAQEIGPAAARRIGPDCHRASGGNPLLARALIEDNWATATADEHCRLVIGECFGKAMLSCLYRSEPGVLELARTLAALGESASTALLSRLLDIDPESTALAVNTLTVAGLLHRNRFQHDSARMAVLGSMAPADRKDVHGRAAKMLHEEGAGAQIVARHLIAADSPQSWAVPVLQEAAEQHLADGQTAAAVSFLRLARKSCTDERQHAEITSVLNSAVWRIDPAAAQRYLPELTSAVRKGHLTGRHAGRVFGQLLWHGQPTEAVDLLRSLPEPRFPLPPEAGPAQPQDAIRLWLRYLYPGLSVQPAPDHAGPRRRVLPSGPDPQLLAAAALDDVLTGSADEDLLAGLERLLGCTRLHSSTLMPIAAALTTLVYADRPAEARSWCDAFLLENSRHRVPLWTSILETIRAMVCYRDGDLTEAERRAREALHLISAKSWGVAIAAPLSVLILAETAMGDHPKAADYLSVQVPEATFHSLFGAHYLLARGEFHLAAGHVHAALQNFEACGRLVTDWGFDSPSAFPWRTASARAYVAQKLVRPAAALLTEQMAMLPDEISPGFAGALRAKAATVDPAQRVPLLERAARILSAHESQVELAYTLADLSRAHRSLGRTALAAETAARARELAEKTRAEPVLGLLAVGTGPDSAGGDPVGLVLSDAEKRVAMLAAAGHTNRQIAHKLYITVSTVEQHLTKVYRKLSVRRRSDLLTRLSHETTVG